MLWLTLERGDGTTTRMGVTTAHPLFVVGEGWAFAEELAPGDAIRDRHRAELRVLAVDVDDTPQLAYNLEIADAHTYFAGELEAWGHNGLCYYVIKFSSGNHYVGKGCPLRMGRSAREKERKHKDTAVEKRWHPAATKDSSFFGELLEMEMLKSQGSGLYNKIN